MITRLARKEILRICLIATVLLGGCADNGPAEIPPTPVDEFVIQTPTPGTPIPQTPTPQTGETTYVVQPGDSLSGIAAKFGISQEALQQANEIDDPDSVYAGQQLVIPAH